MLYRDIIIANGVSISGISTVAISDLFCYYVDLVFNFWLLQNWYLGIEIELIFCVAKIESIFLYKYKNRLNILWPQNIESIF